MKFKKIISLIGSVAVLLAMVAPLLVLTPAKAVPSRTFDKDNNPTKSINFDSFWDGYDITIGDGSTVTMDGDHSFNNLTIKKGGTLTQSVPDNNNRVPYTADYFTIVWHGFIENSRFSKALLLAQTDNGAKFELRKVGQSQWQTINSGWQQNFNGMVNTGIWFNQNDIYEIKLWYHEESGDASFRLYWQDTLGAQYNVLGDSNYITCNALGCSGETPFSELFLNVDEQKQKLSGTCGSSSGINGLCGTYYAVHRWTQGFDQATLDASAVVRTRIDQGDLVTSKGGTGSQTYGPRQYFGHQFKFTWTGNDGPLRYPARHLGLTITGTLKLETGGKIDLNGTGHAGGIGIRGNEGDGWGSSVTGGHGSGGGFKHDPMNLNNSPTNNSIAGGGGGYGGNGANGVTSWQGVILGFATNGGAAYGDQANPLANPLLTTDLQYSGNVYKTLGSGGAGGIQFNGSSNPQYSIRNGGRGGGGIYINAKKVDLSGGVITVNGTNGDNYNSCGSGCGGGGSGGLIYIQTSAFTGAAGNPTVNGGVSSFGNPGLAGIIINNFPNFGSNLSANGGAPNGGGGRIVIAPSIPSIPTVSFDNTPSTQIISENGGNASLQLDLTNHPASDITVGLTVAPATSDYSFSSSVTFTPTGPLSETVNFNAVDNAIIDGSRTYTVTINGGLGYTVDIANSTRTITIDDDDFSHKVTVRVWWQEADGTWHWVDQSGILRNSP